jgi:hypothetical protein
MRKSARKEKNEGEIKKNGKRARKEKKEGDIQKMERV